MSSGGKNRKSAMSANEIVMAVSRPNFAFNWKSDRVNIKNPAIKTIEVIHNAVPT